MSSYDSRVQLTSKSSVIYKFLVHADTPQGARVKVQNHLRKLGDFDFSEICISSMEVRGDVLLLNPDGTKCLIF
ncbi:hypothetical protein FKM52_15240 [Mixta tenebrionis]|jgi:hypothetical protein|uniref:Uncharacterized protein n=1 Tax=Mixta tenebrionis TaxID=2562439 RepID=A0A506V6C3_9GAMM|nr:hypothetical protein HMPREF9692_03951 [Klebsiella oxytoca 10-5248]OFV49862.1 hypothetical protein HMPREF3178_13655 [Klebsiella sp. HMSC09D12]TPW41208.1 hypothetical protein FKM52_15240 [Mixta tenebrionis]TXU95731.1 hypothetical protein D4M90_13430 [Klebsiella oxytoca]